MIAFQVTRSLRIASSHNKRESCNLDISPKAKPTEEANVHELLGILRKANYQGYVTLEYEHSENPWTGVPKWLGRLREEIARA